MNKRTNYQVRDFEDNLFSCNWNKSLLASKIKTTILTFDGQLIVTHNRHGEYNHVQHTCTRTLEPRRLGGFAIGTHNNTQLISRKKRQARKRR